VAGSTSKRRNHWRWSDIPLDLSLARKAFLVILGALGTTAAPGSPSLGTARDTGHTARFAVAPASSGVRAGDCEAEFAGPEAPYAVVVCKPLLSLGVQPELC
jgi:hypothetical protein